MAKLNAPIYPDQWCEGANLAAESRHVDVLEWMARLNAPIYPSQEGANLAAENGHLDVLKWMARLNAPVYPSQEGANNAAGNGHDILMDSSGWQNSIHRSILISGMLTAQHSMEWT